MVRLGLVIPEFKLDNFWSDMAKIANISEYPGRNLTIHLDFTGLVGIWVVIIIPIFVWWLPKGRCYGNNQLDLRAVCRRRQERPSIFALAFDNESDDREAAVKRLNGNNPATSCTNVVHFRCQNAQFLPRFAGSSSVKSSDDLIDELPVEKRHLSKLIIICRI